MAGAWAADPAGPGLGQATGRVARLARQVLSPPLRDRRFWVVQALVFLLAGLHLLVDLHSRSDLGPFPGGIPVALLIVPVGYAALRYGLTGSAATAAWATLLWLPDLVLPVDQGHAPSDIVNLVLVDVVALFFGQRIEAERHAHARVEKATLGRLRAEASYRQLFETNHAPILVLDSEGVVRDANPAARQLFGPAAIGGAATAILGDACSLESLAGRVLTLGDGHDYRAGLAELPRGGAVAAQVVLEDVTRELSESRRAAQRRALTLAAEEEQRRRIARELHDEPLQLFLHLARKLDLLGQSPEVPAEVATSLEEARERSLEAAARLRSMARDLRPPALDQLGLLPALAGFLAEVEEQDGGLLTELEVVGAKRRYRPEVELAGFRIVQEAVRNVIRHAGASRVLVTLSFTGELLGLGVLDDGRGLGRAALDDSSEHLGLIGMSERASLLGGWLEVNEREQGGTSVRAELPAEQPATAAQLPRLGADLVGRSLAKRSST